MYLNLIIAHSALHMGAIQLCWTHLQAVKELGNTHPVVEVLTAAHTIFGELFLHLGENNEAYKELEEGLVYAGHNYHSQENLFWLGMSQRARGEVEDGNRIIDKVLTEIRSEAMTSLWLKATLNNAIWLVQNDNIDEAIRVVKTIQKMVANSELKTPKILMQYFQSYLEFVRNNPSAAKAHALKTIKLAQESQQRWIEINAWVLLWKLAQEPAEKDRIHTTVQGLLDTMGMNIQDAWLLDVFSNYRRHIFDDY